MHPTFYLSVRIRLYFKSHQRWSLLVVVGGPGVQESEWPSTSRVIICQWHSAI